MIAKTLQRIFLVLIFAVSITCNADEEENNDVRGDSKDIKTYQALTAKDAMETVQAQLQALRSHDVNKAYYAYTTASFREATAPEAFQIFIRANPPLARNATAEFGEPIFQSKIAIFRGTLTSIDNQTSIVEFALTQEDGQWKILGMKVFPVQE